MRSNKSPGQLKENGVVLLPQEKRAVNYLIEHGLDITLIPPSPYPGVKTPDLITKDNLPWEIKSITKAKDSTIQHAFSKGVKQAKNLIFDVRGLSSTQADKAYLLVIKIFQQFRQARRLMIITKSGTLETYQK